MLAAQYGYTRCNLARKHASAIRRAAYSVVSSKRRPPRLAIIGAGPAGYYSAYRIMKKLPNAFIDMYEALPTPYGLVRFGVAPDHPEVKKSSVNLDDVAKWPNFNYVGNVRIGSKPQELPLQEIAEHYDGILFSYGASEDKTLGIPGEDLRGVYSARAFVGWYNGLPEYANLNPDLVSGDSAVILGQGNVALDVARILLAPVDTLAKSDITSTAIEVLSKSRIKTVSVIGRRGPLQAPATIKELRELMELEGARFRAPKEGWSKHIGPSEKSLPRQLKRIVELLMKGSRHPEAPGEKHWQLRYLLSPLNFVGEGSSLSGVTFEQMEYSKSMADAIEAIVLETKDKPDWERLPLNMNKIRALSVQGTGQSETLNATLAFRSIGYLSKPLDGLQDIGITFDEKLGIIPNDINGRVLSPSQGPGPLAAGHVPGMYCAGWVKRGPTGVIASTLDDAFRTADILINDWESGVTFNERASETDKPGLAGIMPVIKERGIQSVSWQDWETIDAEERRRGEAKGKVREKLTNINDMLQLLKP